MRLLELDPGRPEDRARMRRFVDADFRWAHCMEEIRPGTWRLYDMTIGDDLSNEGVFTGYMEIYESRLREALDRAHFAGYKFTGEVSRWD